MLKLDLKHQINSKEFEFKTQINQGEITAIFGESGAGKTTLLKIIAGLIKPNCGYLEVDNEIWFDSKKNINLSIQKRKIGFMFQDYALFPNMNVKENLSYANKNETKINEFLELMNLKELAKAYPKELSGGQAQRVALARALIREPKILLLDEPLSALDFKMRMNLQDELAKILHHFKITTLLVSHDIAEIYKLSHKIIEIQNGKIIKNLIKNEFFTQANLSAKLRLNATLLEVKKSDILIIFTLLLNQDIVKITLSEEEFLKDYQDVKIGDTLLLSIKAFNPIIVGKIK
ncbi:MULTISPECIES: sulfate/molybdate ABC transporter ATP-binding protein [Campylobacter]|uniref:Sulfate/molybdate ABC transporter ATP-binding protein n=1 Tax=Campylobacter molothri TaxID=1032242 RepID=A0ACC5W0U8_9BACT|nr:sulfate/molybdate ABC transporter ATP-binding protein [Campylobacter sp. RM10537]MBZ7931233.1 sulfate/molybdate ABC transporter ATP-binding protein [Campylobacter sp. RM12910]MBZ7932654.1 sulfate/molybdate ABC transporter ATP-binding protein [Campylobacter sp. RM10543]MBZ7934184.1 sulfate/molybdate ABC transporter ATP-binding protein [Campylobacter sp. W0065]MBZ7937022.1 sulfate/molybdate ABC transporter ATP-binding protein [Campylobacter sp. RM10538]MBZ7940044.1 sulfate/molybdate ABC trans